ncbi:MAG: MFS transporter [Deltaproteobacteria bacterium]|nr:MFS transporter [Deltaproteobacteria bacterium]
MSLTDNPRARVALTVLVSALGYFVDIYDLILFAVVRKPSLQAIGIPAADMESAGGMLISLQMAGMLTGGIIWGVMGDRLGRKSTLFGSILVYSLANLLNAYVTTLDQYALLRFVAGLGLAGELGAAVTLVSESMSAQHRGIGTTIVAAVGVCGALLAAWVGKNFAWTTAYLTGGVLGLALLALRFGTFESGLFDAAKQSNRPRGDLRMLLWPPRRLGRYLTVIATGVPIWFSIGILVVFANEFAKDLRIHGEVTGATAVFWAYLGLGVGDLSAGLISQALRSRRKALLLFLALDVVALVVYCNAHDSTVQTFCWVLFLVGTANGYWAVFATTAAEQFGTNLRATVATTAPNFVRGSLVAVEWAWKTLKPDLGRVGAAAWVGGACLLLAVVAVWAMRESFDDHLDFYEE